MFLRILFSLLFVFSSVGFSDQNITFHNTSALEVALLSHFQVKDSQDRQYVLRTIQDINLSFIDLLKTEVSGPAGIRTLAHRSTANSTQGISVTEFLGSVDLYEQALVLIKNKIHTLTLLPAIQNSGLSSSVDFTELLEHYFKNLRAVETMVSQLVFNISLPNKEIYVQTGLDVSLLKEKNLYSADDIIRMRKEASVLRTFRTADLRQIDETYNRFILQKVLTYIDTFGSSQRYRSQSNLEGLERAQKDLEEAFWTRSYIRAVYGMKLGSFGTDYTKRAGNLDFFGPTKVNLLSEFLHSDNDLMKMQDLIYNSLETQEGKSREVLQFSTPFFSRVSSFATWIKGGRQEALANHVVLKYLLSDIHEELLLGKAGGLKEMRLHYKHRYHKSLEDRNYYVALANRYLPSSEAQKGDLEADVDALDADSLRGVFQNTIVALDNQQDRIYQAQGIMEAIRRLTQDNDVRKKADLRRFF